MNALLPLALVLVACDSGNDASDLTGIGGSSAGTSGASGAAGSAGAGSGAGGAGGAASGAGGGAGSGSGATAGSGAGTVSGAGAGAGGATSGGAGSGTTGGSGGKAGGATGGAGAASGAGGTMSAGGAPDPGDHSPEGTCARWNADREDMSEGTWSGDLASCDPGDISAEGRANALRLVNLYRWLADMPPVVTEPERDATEQACALLMDANNKLSHEPPDDWTCWTEEAAQGAGSSNISSGPGVSTVDGYMVDNGNADTLGHRRWILSNSLGPIGLGSTGPSGASCMQTLNGTGKAGKQWVAWPPAGAFPVQAVSPSRFGGTTLDDMGWLLQSDSVDLAEGTLTVTSDGTELDVNVSELPGGYGSRYALSIVPDGWETTAGKTYTVTLTGASMDISYDIEVVDCAE